MQIQVQNIKPLENIELIVIGITAIFLIGAAFLLIYVNLYNEKKKKHILEKQKMQHDFTNQLLQSQIETQEETFSALSKELHDNIGQLLNSTKLLIGVTQRTLAEPPDTLRIAGETVGTAIQELRALSKSLSKEWLQQFDFMQNLENEGKRINAADSMRIHFVPEKSIPFKRDEQIILFRIVQEALQNTIKHAKAKNVYIDISRTGDVFTIGIRDDGKGFQQGSSNGVGMMNMQQRTKLLGGTIAWQATGNGTNVLIELPLKPFEQ
jgi:signal transduction histidine kinase